SDVIEAIDKFNNDFVVVVDGIDVVGFVRLEDVFWKLCRGDGSTNISNLLRKPRFVVYEGIKFLDMLEKDVDFSEPVFVVNDMGTVIGVVSRDRVFEMIKKSVFEIKKRNITSRSFVVSGDTSIFEVFDMIGKNYSNLEKEYTWLNSINTVGGIIMFLNGFLPEVGQRVRFSDVVFQVLEISGFMISKVKVIV
ncbi:MAG: transporter associated domain-containing protein, partial [Brevinematia bacterium]